LDGLALHPRHARQGFAGRADWSLLAQAAAAVRIPLLGSGDVTTAEEAGRMLSETGCAGVMLGRGALGRPWLFEDAARHLAGRPVRERGPAEVEEVMRRHLGLLRHYEGEVAAGLAFKGWASRYLRGLPGAKELRREIFTAPDAGSMLNRLAEYFGRLREQERG
jgi:tRNA-dihydrouridine synthase